MSDDRKIITRTQVLNLMCQIVGEYGVDYVYEKIEGSCYNWDRDRNCPSCLIGHVVSRLGASEKFLSIRRADSAPSLIGWYARECHHEIEYGVMDILSTAQLAQDQQETWGFALTEALTVHNEIMKNLAIEAKVEAAVEDEVQA
jgi:hypothetical protein